MRYPSGNKRLCKKIGEFELALGIHRETSIDGRHFIDVEDAFFWVQNDMVSYQYFSSILNVGFHHMEIVSCINDIMEKV